MKLVDITPLGEELLTEMSMGDIRQLENGLSALFKQEMGLSFGISRHFIERTLDASKKHPTVKGAPRPDREREVTKGEIFLTLKKLIDQYGNKLRGMKQHGREIEATVTNVETDLNIVFKIDYGSRAKYPLFNVITVMRKKNFKPYRGINKRGKFDDARYNV